MLGKRTSIRVEQRRERARREILDAAWDVAGEVGIAQLTLKDIADRVGMRPPSLYSHFPSKGAIYDAMFGEGWSDLGAEVRRIEPALPEDARAKLLEVALLFFDFSVANPARFTLLNQRTISGFEPGEESFESSIAAFEAVSRVLASAGVEEPAHVDLALAIMGGLANAQLANDPGGDRYRKLVPAALDMFADAVGIERSPS